MRATRGFTYCVACMNASGPMAKRLSGSSCKAVGGRKRWPPTSHVGRTGRSPLVCPNTLCTPSLHSRANGTPARQSDHHMPTNEYM